MSAGTLNKDGSRFWGSGILTAFLAEDGTLRGFVKIMRDLTERKQAQDNLEALNLQLSRLNHQLHQNLTETYHRVKNNLQVAAALVDVITQTEAEIIPLREVKRVGQHIQAMARIHDLLTQEVKADATASGISIQSLVEKLAPLLQQTVDGRELRLEVEDLRLPAKVSSTLSILINELVTNAVKYGQGVIELRVKRIGERVQLTVSDSGPGFPTGFNPRQAAHTGLELVESLSRLDLGGEVVFANRDGGGASVSITFPPGQ